MNRNTILVISIALNLGLLAYLILKKEIVEEPYSQYGPNINLSDDSTFKQIFIKKDDSLYLMKFSGSFKINPVQAYLLASTYYGITRNKRRLEEIDMVRLELKAIYGETPPKPITSE